MKTCVKLLSVTVLFLCIYSAAGLECMSCADFSCSSQNPQTCSSWQTLCYTSAINDSGRITIIKGCTSPDNNGCTDGGTFYSYNYGSSRLHKIMCCDSDQCNSAELPIPAPPAGSLQCYGWDPDTEVSTANVTCNVQEVCAGFEIGVECSKCTDSTCSDEHPVKCFKNSPCYTRTKITTYSDGTNYTSLAKGCIIENLCSIAQPEVFSFNTGHHTETLSCCNVDGCNALPQTAPAAGSLQCYACTYWIENCTYISCDAGQSCTNISYYGRDMTGCVSNNLCNTRMLHLDMNPSDSVVCCNTTHCNQPASAALTTTTTTSTTTTTTTTTTTLPTSAAAQTTSTTDSRSVVFMKMKVDSVGAVSNTTLSEALAQFLREQLNSTASVRVKKIIQTKSETNHTTSAPEPTQAPPTT